ncbi:MAG: GNAT family N-acetyltransferase [Pirellulaceae bacterium]|nr:GNAT family N-acetyltransferase [Pirellulaceae bacterium]
MALQLIEISANGQPSQEVAENDLISSVCQSTAQLYGQVGFVPPWIGYVAILDGQVVGACGFKSPPRDNQVEIAYFTLPGNEGRGVGTEMARKLIGLARLTESKIVILAQTLPAENASTRILRKLGFAHRGTVVHPEDGNVWEWELVSPENGTS